MYRLRLSPDRGGLLKADEGSLEAGRVLPGNEF